MPRAIARLLFLPGAALCLALAACGEPAPPPPPFHNTDITGAGFGAEFPQPLTDHRGQARELKDFRGKAVILFFGYTHCPDVCPTALARFAEAVKQLGPTGQRVHKPVIVTKVYDKSSPLILQNIVDNNAFAGPEYVTCDPANDRIFERFHGAPHHALTRAAKTADVAGGAGRCRDTASHAAGHSGSDTPCSMAFAMASHRGRQNPCMLGMC